MEDLERITDLEDAMLRFFQNTTSKEFEETGEYRFAQAMEASIEGGDMEWAWFCMARSANLGFSQAIHVVKQTLIGNKPMLEVLTNNLISCAEDFMRWKYNEYCNYKAYIDNKIKNHDMFINKELDNIHSVDTQIIIDEHVLITFEIFLDNLLSENPEYYSQLHSKYKSGILDEKLMSLNSITDMADLNKIFYDF